MSDDTKMELENTTSAGKAESSTGTITNRFEIKKWNAVTMWQWDICADTCAICRNSLNEPSIEYQASPTANNENGLSIAFGNSRNLFPLSAIRSIFVDSTVIFAY